jgi:hypothetical protein
MSSIPRSRIFVSFIVLILIFQVIRLYTSGGPSFHTLPAHKSQFCDLEDGETPMILSKTTTNSLEGNYMTGINTTSAFDDATHVAFDLSREKPVRRCFRKGWEVGNGGLDDGDRDLLVNVYTDANSVFEFGLGESTRIAAAVGVPVFSGVDSDAVYVSESRKTSPSHFKFYFADVGLTGHWGMPLKVASKQVMQYQLSALQSEKLPFDVYLVDGRYRVASACAAFLHASKYGKKNVSVLMHDYHERPEYYVVQDFADIIERSPSGNLVLFQRKTDTTDEDIFANWVKYKNITE